jgi:selenocysteine lyase/cysteine desulfurase
VDDVTETRSEVCMNDRRRAPLETHAEEIRQAAARLPGRRADDAARDETFWAVVQRAFAVDRRIVNLNNGGLSSYSRDVMTTLRRELHRGNRSPAYALLKRREATVEAVRARLAQRIGADAEEVAITRNASESMTTLLLGLALGRGDEIVSTDHEHPRMLATLRQREQRDGVVHRTVVLPMPLREPEAVVDLLRRALTPRTRALFVSHVLFTTGQVLPIRAIADLGRAYGIPLIVDGAHALGQIPFRVDELGCDFYGATLHKWTMGPHGGVLFARRERIRELWPLLPPLPGLEADIRKFEGIGTHAATLHRALLDAFDVHDAIGLERLHARLQYLRNRWAEPIGGRVGAQLLTDLRPDTSSALGTVTIDGMTAPDLVSRLRRRHRIVVSPVVHAGLDAIRVTPAVYTQVSEIDALVDALDRVLSRHRRRRIPASPSGRHVVEPMSSDVTPPSAALHHH